MPLNIKQLRHMVVTPTLEEMARRTGQASWSSASAIELVLATGYVESRYEAVRQYARRDGRRGPARGMWQCEPRTHADYWRWLVARELDPEVYTVTGYAERPHPDVLMHDLRYACLMCRVHYRRIRAPLPRTYNDMAKYWKRWYNSPKGAGTVDGFERAHRAMRRLEAKQLL